MSKIFELFNNNKHTISWTLWYCFFVWTISYILFNFNIFNLHQWQVLLHARLSGFGGFIFTMFILAIIPLYIATIKLVIKKKEMLIKLPTLKIPKFFIDLWAPDEPSQKNTPAPTTPPETKETQSSDSVNTVTINPAIPLEIQNSFARALKKTQLIHIEKPKNLNAQDTFTDTPNDLGDTIPLPTDFDIQFDNENTPDTMSAPVFSEINFDSTPTQPENITNTITKHLDTKNQEYKTEQDVIITKKHAIITHDDNDFWVTDEDNWFASGKTRQSPIKTVQNIAQTHNVTPVLYLETKNILDIDDLIKKWESDSITIISSPTELPE